MAEVLVGRQAIYKKDLRVFGYELLFRDSRVNRAHIVDDAAATGRVILNTFLEIGLNNVVGEGRAFINFTRSLLVGEAWAVLPPERVVVEVLETVAADPEVVAALRRLASQGYTIALDDFSFRPEVQPLVDVCHMVKLDVLALGREGIREHAGLLKPRGIQLVAEKIDSHEDYEFCKSLDFDLFQGYFLCQPNIISGKRVSSHRATIVPLLSRLQQPSVEMEQLVVAISRDVALSYKLLQYLNSTACGLTRKVESLREAVIYVGMSRLRSWASLILLGGIEDKPRELVATALQRAKMCELLAAAQGAEESAKCRFFSVGLFSVLDAMLDSPLEEVLHQLPLAAPLTDALLRHQGILGMVLRCVLAYEHADWENVTCPGVDSGTIKAAYLESIAWAAESLRELSAAR